MGKYLQMLDELYQPEEIKQISTEIEVTKPTKALLSPFVTSHIKDIQFFSGAEPENANSDTHKEKTVKASKQEVTKPTKGIAVAKDIKTTDHEMAEHLINSLELHDDRVFVRQCLIGIYGSDRLAVVQEYFNQWYVGSSSEPISRKKDNAGRYRANVWIREEKFS